MHKFQRAIVLVVIALGSAGSALATGNHHPPPPPAPLPFEVTVTPVLASVTRSQDGLTTYAQYTVSIRNPNTWGLGLKQGKFTASTNVLPAGTGTAPFFSTDNTACSNPTPTSIECTVPDLVPGASIVPFTVTLTAPGFTPPSNGGQIDFTHQSSARFDKQNSSYDPIVATPPVTVSTTLIDPNPNTVATVLPLATGGTVFTGTEGGAATCDNPWIVSVKVPQAATVSLDTAPAPDTPPVAATCSAGDCQFFAAVSIPQAIFAPTNPLVTTLRRDRCTIEGRGIIGKALQIFEEKIFYRGDEQSAYTKVYPCRITGGPTPGIPCIASRGIYTIFNLPNVPDKLLYLGDHFWNMNSTENGRWAAP